jgi:two-component system response regulator HydG
MKAGDVGMLKERVEGMLGSGDQLAAVDVPSGVLVGVSPVNVPVADKGARKDGVAGHFGLLHVLVVDDDEAMRKACCEIASGMGFAVVLGAQSRRGRF